MTDKPAEIGVADGSCDMQGLLTEIDGLSVADPRPRLDALAAAIGRRGFGPVVILLCATILLPSGMIPGLPFAVAAALAATALSMIAGARSVALPSRIGRMRLPAGLLSGLARRGRPAAAQLGRLFRPRWTAVLTTRAGRTATGLVLLVSATKLALVGLVPGLPFLVMMPVLLLALGLTYRDGLAVCCGALAVIGTLGLGWRTAAGTLARFLDATQVLQ